MQKKYSLDFSIERDIDRLEAVNQILDKLDETPSQPDLEQMASYILYGRDEHGRNSIQRNETIETNKRYFSYRSKDDKMRSLDEIMDIPSFDEQQIRFAYQRDIYIHSKTRTIRRPRYDSNGNMIDPGDSVIPGMVDVWDSVDRWQRMLDIAQGKIVPNEDDTLVTDPYRVYQLKHNLIDIRRQQYYLLDSYRPEIHFQGVDHPKPQFYDWCGDSFYWIPYAEWQDRINHLYTVRIPHDLSAYETRGEGDNLEVKWVVRRHTFDWENPLHVRALFAHYHTLYEALKDKLETYGRTLLWDFDRYVSLCNFSDLRMFLIELRKQGLSYEEMREEMKVRYNITYGPNYFAQVLGKEIPRRIARAATIIRLEVDTPPEQRKVCAQCGREYPCHPLFFSKNSSRTDGYMKVCKQCEKENRIQKGVGSNADRRTKDQTMP